MSTEAVRTPADKTLAFVPPKHWDVMPLRYLFESVGGGTPSKDNAAYWSGEIPWVSPKDMKTEVVQDSEDHISPEALVESRLTLLPPKTVLIVVRGMILAHTIPVALAGRSVTINQDMKGLTPRDGILPEYLAYLLRAVSPLLFSTIEEAGHGTLCLRLDLWRNILVGIPPLAEQQRIVEFLDQKLAQIDVLVKRKQELLNLLRTWQQAFLNQAVTRGLDDAVAIDSQAEWLGCVPKHWRVERLKWRIARIEQGWSPQCESRSADQGEWGVLKVGCMNSGSYDESENKALPSDLAPLPDLEVKIGDVLMSRSNTIELVGSAGRVHQTQGRILLCDKLYRIDLDEAQLDPEYAVLLLRSHATRLQIERDASGASPSMKNISNEVVGNLVLAFPPISEQRRIVSRLSATMSKIMRSESAIREQLKRLSECRLTRILRSVQGECGVGSDSHLEVSPVAPTRGANPYFRRSVFAAEIIDQLCDEPTFGHVKFQKCFFVAQHHLRLGDFAENYKRAAAGPYDNRLIRSVDSQLQKSGWFESRKVGGRYIYRRLDRAGDHRRYFESYFNEQAERLRRLLELFRPLDTDRSEIVATLYAVWNDFLIQNESFDDVRIVREVLTNWDESKQRFSEERWLKALGWMRENELVPTGFGKPTFQ